MTVGLWSCSAEHLGFQARSLAVVVKKAGWVGFFPGFGSEFGNRVLVKIVTCVFISSVKKKLFRV